MLSKMDAGTLLLKHEKVDIYTVLNLAAENISDLLLKEHISVDIPDKGCIEFFGDLEWTMEALINLMKNCMEHSHSGGHVYCDYTWNPLYAEIQIWDEGRGFAPKIFHIFLSGFTGGNMRYQTESALDWPLPGLSLNCRTGQLPPGICRLGAPVSR